ncbi:MAG: hypothetical protein CL670_06480 [Balneola sp.]|jgi:hypothetical protein|nr:hypothetical protein [Balneola sp.]MAL18919.1 hypothetical protein [Balneola sp.]MBE78784.1 hypothetical protein [Balneola sp.]HBX64957.1 hypothetical protein [Balneolaceae bacterium]|tara:strand:+ start:184 stop:1269 length:1086 start_codon:yes stop_codon:yes gene_type:complete
MKKLLPILFTSTFLLIGCDLFDSASSSKKKEIEPFFWGSEKSFPDLAPRIWVSPNDHIFAGGDSAWFLSTDYGETFSEFDVPDEVLSFAVKKYGQTYYGKGQVLSDFYIIAGDTLDRPFFGGAFNLYTSKDGNNWAKISGPFQMFDFIKHQDLMYVGEQNGVVVHNLSTGEEYAAEFQFDGENSLYVQELKVNSKGAIFAGTLDAIYRSKDQGRSWELVTEEISERFYWVEKIIIEDEVMYGVGSKILKSTDSGENWTISDYTMENYEEGEIEQLFITDFDISADGYKYTINYLGFFINSEKQDNLFKFYGPEKYERFSEDLPMNYSEVHSFRNGGVLILSTSNYFYRVGTRNSDSKYWIQ